MQWSDEKPTNVKLVIKSEMEYKKDKRTNNLTLRDIHVGDWVQVWSEQSERYSPPLKIIQICDDGTIYLVTSEEERTTPWEEDIKNVDALPITPELLKGFGFVLKDTRFSYSKDDSCVFYKEEQICSLMKLHPGPLWGSNCYYKILIPYYSFMYFHEFIQGIYKDFPEILKLEWKGVEK